MTMTCEACPNSLDTEDDDFCSSCLELMKLARSDFDFDAFVQGYIDCILWCDVIPAEADPDHPDYDENESWFSGGGNDLIVSGETRAEIIKLGQLCEFCAGHLDDLLLYCEQMGPWSGSDDRGYIDSEPAEARAGHDFYLTRAGHGTGFWDRGLDELGDRLSEAAKCAGSVDDHTLYANDDGKATL